MKPRIEQKLEFDKSDYTFFLKWLNFKRAKILYPERIICSRYLDNLFFKMYQDTVEGLVPRKKIRIRTYNSLNFLESKVPYTLEVKKTTEFKRFKSIKKNININILNTGYYDNEYGQCYQKVDISYLREYFIIGDTRITIDKNIKYKKVDFINNYINDEFAEKSFVLELKTVSNKSLTELSNEFDFPRSRFSKYERAIESFKK